MYKNVSICRNYTICQSIYIIRTLYKLYLDIFVKFNNNGGIKTPKGITKEEKQLARSRNIPESIISKMGVGARITNDEMKILNSKKLVYVPPFRKAGGFEVRGFLRKYTNTQKMRDQAKMASKVWSEELSPRQRALRMPGGDI
ncbi:MAG: hypothetical protein E3J52_10355 [Promethearchaeota archaeon]|nr:MAG: hypothetical protein E3J52_10355 [Candidatus Lokiarchaeota archaeon]